MRQLLQEWDHLKFDGGQQHEGRNQTPELWGANSPPFPVALMTSGRSINSGRTYRCGEGPVYSCAICATLQSIQCIYPLELIGLDYLSLERPAETTVKALWTALIFSQTYR